MDIQKDQRDLFIDKINAIRTALDECAQEALTLLWQEREYVGVTEKGYGGGFAPTLSDVVAPGAMGVFYFGVEHKIPGTEVLGLPETIQTRFGVERDFNFMRLAVDDDVAPHFAVQNIQIGARMTWGIGVEVAALKFAASASSPVIFGKEVGQGLIVAIQVRNTTDVERRFRAKIIGREQIRDAATAAKA
jgi:hypothetical protein